jgi:hypothetical protein
MNNKQIYSILKSDKHVQDSNFLGVFPIDLIPMSAMKYPCCLIVNTKPSNHPGEHWVAVFKTEDNVGVYFDSYGNPPYNLPEIGEVLESCDDWKFNSTTLQSPMSTTCGQYTVFVIAHLARGYELDYIVELLNDCGDTYANDAFIFNYIKQTYGDIDSQIHNLKVIDFPFIFDQIASPMQ